MGRASTDEIERLKRDANLVEYACTKARYQVDLNQSSPRGNPTYWILRRPADGSKILAVHGPNCWLYFDLRMHGSELGTGGLSAGSHGTIIDFIQEEMGLPTGRGTRSFGLALKELREFVGIGPSTPHRPPIPRCASGKSSRQPTPEVLRRWEAAREATCSLYLAGRGLAPSTLSHPRFQGTWRIDNRGNALFAHRDGRGQLVGYEIKNSNFTSYPRGGVRTGMWRSNDLPGDRYYLLTESAINALSFHQLHPYLGVTHRSFGGRICSPQLRALQVELDRLPTSTTVLLAFDGAGDLAGQHYEQQVRSVLPRGLAAETAHPPNSKDWNDYLQAIEPSR